MEAGNTLAAHKGRFFHGSASPAPAETVSADPPGRGGGSMLEDEGHQAKDAPPIMVTASSFPASSSMEDNQPRQPVKSVNQLIENRFSS